METCMKLRPIIMGLLFFLVIFAGVIQLFVFNKVRILLGVLLFCCLIICILLSYMIVEYLDYMRNN